MEQCSCTSEHFLDVKQKMMDDTEVLDGHKRKRVADQEVEAAAHEEVVDVAKDKPKGKRPKMSQVSIQNSMNSGTASEIDNVIAELFYGTSIPPAVAGHHLFKRMIEQVKTAQAAVGGSAAGPATLIAFVQRRSQCGKSL